MIYQEIDGTFDGQNLVDDDGKMYPVIENYASKSRLVEGDRLKLRIMENGEQIFKQVGPMPRKKFIGTVVNTQYGLEINDGEKNYRVLGASIRFFKLNPGMKIAVETSDHGRWAAVQNVIEEEQA